MHLLFEQVLVHKNLSKVSLNFYFELYFSRYVVRI